MNAVPNVSFSVTIRLELPSGSVAIGDLTSAVESAGGLVTALDVTGAATESLKVDLTCAAADSDHAEQLVATLREIDDVTVHKVSDRTFLMHLGGVIETAGKHHIRNRDDLSLIYTPGVARISQAIAKDKSDARRLTIKRNAVAVVTDGSAVLGLGNIGPEAALPVMEGKAALFKSFGAIDAWPICLDTQDTEAIVEAVAAISPGFAGINLEDISAPRCFEIEARLRERLDIPVFHDDQHGTAIVVLAALQNALRVTEKSLASVRIVMSGAGAAGTAIARLLVEAGAKHLTVCDVDGVVTPDRPDLSGSLRWIAENTQADSDASTLTDAIADADVFIGVSAPNILDADDLETMADGAIVFALANPVPEVDPAVAHRHASVVATGRSDYPNQINNVLAFPGVFRGLLDAQCHGFDAAMLVAAAEAIATVVTDDELNPNYIIPSVFHPDVHKAVATAVETAARAHAEIETESSEPPAP